MSNEYPNDLEGPLATAVQAAWNANLPQDQIDRAATRIFDKLKLAGASIVMDTKSVLRTADRSENQLARWLAWTSIAAAVLASVFFAGKYTANRPGVAIVTDNGTDKSQPPVDDGPVGDSLERFGFTPSQFESSRGMKFPFIHGVSVHAVQRPGSPDPTDVILYGKGPRENIALGQGFATDSVFVRALADDDRIANKKSKTKLDDAAVIPELPVHFFDPRVSPRSQVLTGARVAGPFAVSPDNKWFVTVFGLQIEIKTGLAVQLPGDWGLVKRVHFAGPDRLILTRNELDRTGEPVCQVEIASFPAMEKLREFENVEWDSMFTTINTFQTPEHAVGIVTADRRIRVYDSDSKQPTAEAQTSIKGLLQAIAISPNGQLMATASGMGGDNNELYIHELPTGKLKHRLSSGQEMLSLRETRAIAFSPDDRFLAAAEVQFLVIYDAETGEVVKRFPGLVKQIFWGADSRSLTTVSTSYVQNYQDGREESIYPYVSHWSF